MANLTHTWHQTEIEPEPHWWQGKLKYAIQIQMCQKLIAQKVLCFFHLKVWKLDSKVCKLDSINSQMASNVLKLNSSLSPRNVRVSRVEDQVVSFEFRMTVNLYLTGTVVFHDKQEKIQSAVFNMCIS